MAPSQIKPATLSPSTPSLNGLTAKTVILQNEPTEEYDAELQNYVDYFQPQGWPEQRLVRQLVAADWRLTRYTCVESGLLNHKMDEQTEWLDKYHKSISITERLAVAFESLAADGNALALANRYQARLQHDYQKILKSLSQMQATRRAPEEKLQNRPSPDNEHSPDEERLLITD